MLPSTKSNIFCKFEKIAKMKKSDLRKIYLEKRKKMSREEVNSQSEKIFQNFVAHYNLENAKKIHLFLSIAKFNEVNTFYFLKYFREHNIRVFIPKIVQNRLISIEFTPETKMEVSSWGIAEPVSNEDCGVVDYDFVITPLLYCDSEGNRVGFGKGYYDGFFKTINPNCKKVGVGFFPPKENIDDVSEADVPLDYLITGDNTLSFGGEL